MRRLVKARAAMQQKNEQLKQSYERMQVAAWQLTVL